MAQTNFKAGDRVRYTDACPDYWFFGPRTTKKIGVIDKPRISRTYKYALVGGGIVADEHIALLATPTVGGWVRCIEDCDGQFTAGKPYNVRKIDGYHLGVVADDKGNPNGWAHDKFVAIAAPFAEGDKVRVVGGHFAGREGVVGTPDAYDDDAKVRWPDGDWRYVKWEYLATIDPYAGMLDAPTPAPDEPKGDTVAPVIGKRYRMRNGEVTGVIRLRESGEYPMTDGDEVWTEYGHYFSDKSETDLDIVAEYAEHAEQQATDTLQIEEGKYYRARNGTVFGPMVPQKGGDYSKRFKWTTPEGHSPWCDDGRFYDDRTEHGNDLIEAVVADQPAPFKVGDRVVTTGGDDSPDNQTGEIVDAYAGGFDVRFDTWRDGWGENKDHWAVSPSNLRHATAQPTYKAGDKVRVKEDDACGGYRAGDVFTLTGIDVDGDVVFIDKDGDTRVRPQADVEPVTDTPPAPATITGPMIVCRLDGTGRPCPANRPFKHDTQAAAEAEAERLGRANPGKTFAVYAPVSRRTADVAVTIRAD